MTFSIVTFLLGAAVGSMVALWLLQLKNAAFSTKKSEQNWVHKLFGLSLPRDITEPLFEVGLDIESGISVKALTIVYSHKYSGLHELGFVCEQPVVMPIISPISVDIHVVWRNDSGMTIFEANEKTRLTELWLDGPARNGFSLVRYQVPDCIPIRERLVCDIRFSDLSAAIASYGPLRAYARTIPSL